MIALAVRRPVATAAVYLALLLLGAYSFRLIPLELLPDVEYPRLRVTAFWRGASPEALEALVTARLEAEASQVAGVRAIRSFSATGGDGSGSEATIDIEFARDTKMEFARLALAERMAALRGDLPEGVAPSVAPYVPDEFAEESRPFLGFRLTGPYGFEYLTQIAEEQIRPLLLGIDGMASVRISGAEPREISIELDRTKLAALDIGLSDVQRRVADAAELRAPGSVELAGLHVALALRARPVSVAELGELVVATRPEGAIRLKDVARIRDGTAEPTGYDRIDGRPAISLFLTRQPDSNAIQLSDRVKTVVGGLAGRLPAGVQLELDIDRSEDIRSQLTDLRLRAIAAALVILLVLMLFLRSYAAVTVVFATIGFSVLIAVNLLYLGGFSLNVLTLAGLAWGFGLVVDNGIVVLENIERQKRHGLPGGEAARKGARQVFLPVLAATATTAIVLVPFLFLQGELRLYYLPLAYAVGFSIFASLFVAFTFVPAISARFGFAGVRATNSAAHLGETVTAIADREPIYIRAYRALLRRSLDHPWMVALVCVASLGASYWLFDQYVQRGVLWRSFWGQETYIDVQIRFPRGAELERTDELTRSFERKIADLPEVERYETTVRPSVARIRVTFPTELEDTPIPVAIKERMVAYSYGFSGVDVRVYGYGPSFYGGGGAPPNYSLQVLGFNYLKVQEIAEDLAARLSRFTRIRDVDPNASRRWYQRDKEFEFFVVPDRAALAGYDLPVADLLVYLGANLRDAIGGDRLRLGGEEVRYAVKLGGYREFDFHDLESLRVPTRSGGEVRVGDVARVERRNVIAAIRREDQQYERTVAWEFRGPAKLGDLVRDAVVDATALPPGYHIETRDRLRWSTAERRQVYVVLALAVLLIYMVTAALFESLAAPFVVLLTLPLALIGVFLIFFYTDAAFTRTAYIGTIMMGGIVVNNAILIVYHIGELRGRLPVREAILQGTLERVRPILMTSLTTIFGLLPLVVFAGSQNTNIWNALALATIGGLLSSTLFVLVAIPVAYQWLIGRRLDAPRVESRQVVKAPREPGS